MFCSNCGSRNDEGYRFCMQCGAPLAEIPGAEGSVSDMTQVLDSEAVNAASQPLTLDEMMEQAGEAPEEKVDVNEEPDWEQPDSFAQERYAGADTYQDSQAYETENAYQAQGTFDGQQAYGQSAYGQAPFQPQPGFYPGQSDQAAAPRVLTGGRVFGMMCLNLIPGFGPLIYFITLIVFSCMSKKDPNRAGMCRGLLLWSLLGVIVIAILLIIIAAMGISVLDTLKDLSM